MDNRKKRAVLICLAIVWVSLFLVQRAGMWGGPTRALSPPRNKAPRESLRSVSQRPKNRTHLPQLQQHRSGRVRPPFAPEIRNIFASIDSSRTSAPSPATSLERTSSAPPRPDPFLEKARQIRFLGYSKADGTTMAFLASGGELLVVPEAEVFNGQFRVRAVKEDSVTLTSLDGAKEVVLELGGASSPARQDLETQLGEPVPASAPRFPGSAQLPVMSTLPGYRVPGGEF